MHKLFKAEILYLTVYDDDEEEEEKDEDDGKEHKRASFFWPLASILMLQLP